MSHQVARQIERILDEDASRTVQLIVHMAGSPDDADQPRQHLALNAREVLPAPVRAARQAAMNGNADAGGVPCRRPHGPGFAAAEQPTAPPTSTLRHTNTEALAPLLDSEPVRRNRANLPGAVTPFWIARSAHLELDRDDVRLVDDIPGIEAVYADRPLSLPPVFQAIELPAAVLEDSAASWGVTATGALAAWGAYGARGGGVTVGVLDTGVDASHPDLKGKVAKWAEFDAAGRAVPGSQPHDSGDHGTHVCGTIAGGNASGQWIGMAPDANLAVALVLNRTSGTSKQILAGITWAVEQGVDVLNLSLSAAVFDAVAPSVYGEAFRTCVRAGIPVVAAIGNRGAQTGATTGSDYFALAVGATDHRDLPAGFSGGRTHVISESPFIPAEHLPLIYIKPDVSAPGVAVTSAVPGGTWGAKNGTSMAAPHVSAAIALLLSAVPELRAELTGAKRALFLRNQITGSADELGEAGHDARYGLGRLNALRAIALATGADGTLGAGR